MRRTAAATAGKLNYNGDVMSYMYVVSSIASLAATPSQDGNKTNPSTSKVAQNPGGAGAGAPGGEEPRWRRFILQYRTEVAAGAASVAASGLTYPMDSIKTRMQNHDYGGVLKCVRHTYQTEKLRGFFRGGIAPLFSVSFVRTTSFSIYQHTKHAYCGAVMNLFGVDVMSLAMAKTDSWPSPWTVATFGAAGATSGAIVSFFACPFELAKLSAQVSHQNADTRDGTKAGRQEIAASYRDKGTFRTIANIVKQRGFPGLYTGMGLHLFRDTLGSALYFMIYETGKQVVVKIGGERARPFGVVLSGAGCGMISWLCIYPIDCSKSQFQRNALNYTQGERVPPVKIEWFQRRMYRGLGVSLVRTCAINAIFFSGVEFLQKRIDTLKRDDGEPRKGL